jgi:hypothetical protein
MAIPPDGTPGRFPVRRDCFGQQLQRPSEARRRDPGANKTRPAINAGARNFRKLFGEIPFAAPGSMVKQLNLSGRGVA